MQVIAAVGEVNASRALKEASDSIAASKTAMQLRYLQTLNIIAAERGSTIMFPIPMDIMGPMVCVLCVCARLVAACLVCRYVNELHLY